MNPEISTYPAGPVDSLPNQAAVHTPAAHLSPSDGNSKSPVPRSNQRRFFAHDDTVSLKRLIAACEQLMETHGRRRMNGAVASEHTFRKLMQQMKNFCRVLHAQGYQLETPVNLQTKHINAVFDFWVDGDISVPTFRGRRTDVQKFLYFLHKPQLAKYVRSIGERYQDRFPDGMVISAAAEHAKSERGKHIDLKEMLLQADVTDQRFLLMLFFEKFFGLRCKEALLLRPHEQKSVRGLVLRAGTTKTGKPRDVVFADDPEYRKIQETLLQRAKSLVPKGEALAWPGRDLGQATSHYYRLCKKIGLSRAGAGITSHSLRSSYAEDRMLLEGFLPPVLGGTKEMSRARQYRQAKALTSDAMGHVRPHITHAYYGADRAFDKAEPLVGEVFGTPMPLGQGKTARLWVSEKTEPMEDGSGRWHLPGVKASLAVVTVQILLADQETERLTLGQFLMAHPLGEEPVEARMNLIGLTLMSMQSPSPSLAPSVVAAPTQGTECSQP